MKAHVLLLMCLCAMAATTATSKKHKPDKHVPAAPKCHHAEPNLPGGWGLVQRASDVPTAKIYALIKRRAIQNKMPCIKPTFKLLAACSQVVAGQNYEVVTQVTCHNKKKVQKVKIVATAYQPLKGPMQITEIRMA